jgi:PAS domain S-box-containing protein
MELRRIWTRQPPWFASYGVALAGVALAVLVTRVLHSAPIFMPAVLLSAWYGGAGAGLAAVVLAALANRYFLMVPQSSLRIASSDDAAYLLIFSLSALFVVLVTARERRAGVALREAHDDLTARARELERRNEQLQTEIAERQRAEAEARNHASLLDLTHDTVFVRDRDDVITYWNRAAEALYGWANAEAIGKVAHTLLHTIFPVPLDEIIATMLATNYWEGELVHTRRDGTRVTVASRWSAQRDDAGRFTGVLETNNNITAAKEAERSLHRSEAYLHEAQKLGHVGSWAATAAGESYISPETLRMFGYDPNVKHPTRDMILARCHPDDLAEVVETSARSRAERREYELDFRIVLPDGSLKYVHSVAHPLVDDRGELVEYVGAILDMTERKQASDALQEALAQLAHVTRVTMLGEITASIAHEVNQPLAAVLMNGNACVRWLSIDPPNIAEARAAAQRIASDGNRAAQVVARVRALVKRTPSVTTELDVNDVIAETLTFTRVEAARRGVAIRMDLSEGLPTLAGDRVQLQQVLVNLILNAIDAMSGVQERARTLTIRSRREGAETVVFEVEDAGTGLEAGESDRIFDAFYSTKPAGLGIGLAVSRSIVELHGGRIAVSPNDGPGVTMRVSLPAVPACS